MSSPSSDILPPPSRLEAAARALEEQEDWPNLIRFVQRWQVYDEPSTEARMREARAYMRLFLVDRATIRLERLAEVPAFERDALLGLAHCHLLRNWPKKAEAALSKALAAYPDDAEVLEALDRVAAGAVSPDADALESSDPDALIAAAELHIATGTFVKAQALLEKARRLRPDDSHAADLLWGLEGDFECNEALGELAERWGTTMRFAELPDEPEHTEHTESFFPASFQRHLDAPDPADSKAFPSLFKGMDAYAAPGGGYNEEVTLTASRARMSELHDALGGSDEAPTQLSDAGNEDTQIALVIRRSEKDGDVDLENSDPAPPIKPQRGRPAGDFDPGLEEEDDDLIVLTGREVTETTRSGHTPALDLDLDVSVGDVSGKVAAILEQVERDRERQAQKERKSKRRRAVVPRRGAGARAWWLFALGAVLFLLAAGVFVLALLHLAMSSLNGSSTDSVQVADPEVVAEPLPAPEEPGTAG